MKVSVIIAAYNVEGFIARAIGSVQAQTEPDWEVIVVDDASKDGTYAVVEAIARKDPRIRLVRQSRNGGPGAARNVGLDAARGEWVAVLDADDAWRPERLEKMLAAAALSGADFVADNQIFYDEALRREVQPAYSFPEEQFPLTLERLLLGDYEGTVLNLGLLKPIVRLDFINSHALRYDPALRYFEDYRFYAEIIISGASCLFISAAYYIYTTPTGLLSNQASPGTRTTDHIPAIRSRFPIVRALCRKYRHKLPEGVRPLLRQYWAVAHRRWIFRRITALRQDRAWGNLALLMLAHPMRSGSYLLSSRSFRQVTRSFIE